MRTTTLAVTGATLASVVLLGPAATAQAAEHHGHAAKVADRKAANKAARVADRRADRKAEKAQVPPQDTTTNPRAVGASRSTPVPGTSGKSVGKPTKTRGVVSCGVSATRAGSSFVVTNTCDTPRDVILSSQWQPSAWVKGLCQGGGCHNIGRWPITIPAGVKTVPVPTGGECGWFQGDLKTPNGGWVKAVHFHVACKPPVKPPVVTPRPPIITPPVKHHHPVTHRPSAHIDGHKKPAQLAFTGPAQYAVIGGTAAVFLVVGAGLIALGGRDREVTRQIRSALPEEEK